MKLTKIVFIPEAEIEFTKAEVQRLMTLSAMHYDHKCKEMGRIGGLIYGMNNHFCCEEPFETVTRQFSFHDLDLLNKVAESSAEFTFTPFLKKMNEEYYRLNKS